MKHLRHILLFFLFLNIFASCPAQQWQDVKGEHFIVYFTGKENFAKEVLRKAEAYYVNIASGLGYPRYSDFWLWDKRVKIYIYPDHGSFIKATAQPEWSHGMADYIKKEILSYAWSGGFIESLLPHEMAHLIFRDFIGFKGEASIWLDEGVAQWAEETQRPRIKKLVLEFYDQDTLLTVNDIMKLRLSEVQEKNRVYIRPTRMKTGEPGVLFLSSESLINIFYLESASLVIFMIDSYGSDSFAHFCRQLRDGKSMDETLRFAYPASIFNVEEFDKRWRKYLKDGG
jgi:hypothetical protein